MACLQPKMSLPSETTRVSQLDHSWHCGQAGRAKSDAPFKFTLGVSIMNFFSRFIFIGIVVTIFSIPAYAADAIRIRYLGGNSPPGQSSEWLTLSISRSSPPPMITASKQDIDRLFEQVSDVLNTNGITQDWQLAIPDAPFIEITLDIEGQKLKLISCHVTLERSGKLLVTERGAEAVSAQDRASVLAKQSENLRRHRVAFEKILSLTLERIHARLSP